MNEGLAGIWRSFLRVVSPLISSPAGQTPGCARRGHCQNEASKDAPVSIDSLSIAIT